jgi:hypothetical protein
MAKKVVKKLLDELIVKTIVLSVTDNFQKILPKETSVKLGLTKPAANGAGPRSRLGVMYDFTAIYGNATESRRYPVDYDLDETDLQKIEDFKRSIPTTPAVVGYLIHGYNTDPVSKHPIRKDIREYYKGKPCVFCGGKGDCVDHKNDAYNDKRVLCENTQDKSDFQPTCNACNIIKRGFRHKTRESGKRALPPPQIRILKIDFLVGDESFDEDDPNTLVGSYWYDPIAFMEGVEARIIQESSGSP